MSNSGLVCPAPPPARRAHRARACAHPASSMQDARREVGESAVGPGGCRVGRRRDPDSEREGSHFVVSSLLENKPTAPFASYGLGKVGTTSAGRSGYIYLTTPARKQRRDRPERGGADTGRGYRAFPPVDFHSISFDAPSEALLPTGLPTSIYLCRDLWPTSRQACQPLRTRPWLCPPLLWAHRLVVFFSSRGAGTPCVTWSACSCPPLAWSSGSRGR